MSYRRPYSITVLRFGSASSHKLVQEYSSLADARAAGRTAVQEIGKADPNVAFEVRDANDTLVDKNYFEDCKPRSDQD